MKYLIVYAHPNPKSFNHAIKEAVVEELSIAGKETSVRDLYALDFNPVLKGEDFIALQKGTVLDDVKEEQEYISSSDIIVFVSPLWWTGLPAILKGYIDRVFSIGFAYAITETGISRLLKDKKALVITTTGTPYDMYEASGMFNSIGQTIDGGIFNFCGVEVIEHKYFTAIPYVTDSDRAKMLEDVRVLVREKLLI